MAAQAQKTKLAAPAKNGSTSTKNTEQPLQSKFNLLMLLISLYAVKEFLRLTPQLQKFRFQVLYIGLT